MDIAKRSSRMEQTAMWKKRNMLSYDPKIVAIVLGILAVVSPLYINSNTPTDEELEDDEPINVSSYLPLLLLILIIAITISGCMDRGLTRFDSYWIYRFGGSSTGIMMILVILALVLKCKASGFVQG